MIPARGPQTQIQAPRKLPYPGHHCWQGPIGATASHQATLGIQDIVAGWGYLGLSLFTQDPWGS